MGFKSAVLPESFLRCMEKKDRAPMGKAGMTRPEIDAKQVAQREKQIQESIAGYLRLRQIPFHQARMDRKTTGPVGWPDFTFCYCGRFVALEAKASNGRLTKEQEEMFDALRAQGAYCRMVFSLGEVVNSIHEIEREAQK